MRENCTFSDRRPLHLKPVISLLAQAHRLREVRVLTGFTRIYPPAGAFASGEQTELSPLRRSAQTWLPAAELKGEGIFVALSIEEVQKWEIRPCVVSRVEKIRKAIQSDLFEQEELPKDFGARLLLLHSLSHALMTRLTLSCGYSSSALIERLYIGNKDRNDPLDMAALMIHTGTPDADGTLGGLVEQGETNLFSKTLYEALKDATWCSSDPLCIAGTATLSTPRNGAACHACMLVPETSCTHFNRYLDRALLVGMPGKKGWVFSSTLLRVRHE